MEKRDKKPNLEGEPGKISHFFLDYVDEIPTMEGKLAILFEGFFKNKMQHVVSVLTNPEIERSPESVKRMIQNVEDFSHHFSPRDNYHEGLYEELLQILKKFPQIKEEESLRGISLLKEIFKIYGFKLDLDKTDLQKMIHKFREKHSRPEDDKRG